MGKPTSTSDPKPHIARQTNLPLGDFALDFDVPLLVMENGDGYVPIKYLVQGMTGSDDDRPHRARIQRDPILSQLACYLPVQTRGGTQDMLCLPWLGIGRFVDRLSLDAVQPQYRPKVLSIMWGITFAAYEVITGKRTLPNLITILPASRLLTHMPEQDLRGLLAMLVERMGQMEIASREMREKLAALVAPSQKGESCPCCGRPFE